MELIFNIMIMHIIPDKNDTYKIVDASYYYNK